MIDVHVHLREPGFEYKETIKTGSMSAAKGGFTTIMTMPNLKPVPDSVENLKVQMDIINKDSVVNIYPYGAFTKGEKGEELADIDDLAKYVKAISDDGVGVNNLELLDQGMKLVKKNNLVIASHAEDNLYKTAPKGEYLAVEREIKYAIKKMMLNTIFLSYVY
ncbi:MAG: amidohydrolase family protein [Clostridium sp.]|nr:MAG: amidohydrolase family protein [Clostridium sp.]